MLVQLFTVLMVRKHSGHLYLKCATTEPQLKWRKCIQGVSVTSLKAKKKHVICSLFQLIHYLIC